MFRNKVGRISQKLCYWTQTSREHFIQSYIVKTITNHITTFLNGQILRFDCFIYYFDDLRKYFLADGREKNFLNSFIIYLLLFISKALFHIFIIYYKSKELLIKCLETGLHKLYKCRKYLSALTVLNVLLNKWGQQEYFIYCLFICVVFIINKNINGIQKGKFN